MLCITAVHDLIGCWSSTASAAKSLTSEPHPKNVFQPLSIFQSFKIEGHFSLDSAGRQIFLFLTTMVRKSKSFLPFPRLPTELRLKIWRAATSLPRVIELLWNSKCCSLCSRSTCSTLLQVCQEYRNELINSYHELQFGQGSTPRPHRPTP